MLSLNHNDNWKSFYENKKQNYKIMIQEHRNQLQAIPHRIFFNNFLVVFVKVVKINR